jgi:predicted HD phosphohydrolase
MNNLTELLPKHIQRQVRYLHRLTRDHNIEKLRQLRRLGTDVIIEIFHHSVGTDSYFCDVEKRYFTWSDITKRTTASIKKGDTLFTAVIEYVDKIHFISATTAPDPNLN